MFMRFSILLFCKSIELNFGPKCHQASCNDDILVAINLNLNLLIRGQDELSKSHVAYITSVLHFSAKKSNNIPRTSLFQSKLNCACKDWDHS